ncbi:MAG: hypothetical protein IT454_13040 [Planctomycetes bacterium]|nr:hypothetical protein [Planctomycetota bacterium]
MSPARLELYVHQASAAGRAAVAHARSLAQSRPQEAFELVVFDVARSPLAAEQAGVLVTPTLILRHGEREWRAIGDLSDPVALARCFGWESSRP